MAKVTTLEEINASAGPDVIIRTLELTSDAWDSSIFICNGFEDQVCVDETGREITFTAMNIDISLAKKDNKGNQTLAFAVDNTTGEVSKKVNEVMEAQTRVNATYRTFLSSNKSVPAEPPYYLNLSSGSIQGVTAQLQCGYFNMISVAWPRQLYTVNYTPALRYL